MMPAWPSPEVAELAEWIGRRTGLTFPPGRLEPAAGSLAAALSGDRNVEATIERLTRHPAVLDQLLAELTIGETYFFRHPEQFEVLRELVLPPFRKRRGARFRAWSAGCATGEEAYSLAILLREEGISADRVIGTDISRARLTAARRGRYRKWSFRGVPAPTVERYFDPSAGWRQLSAEVRAGVEFRYLNLVEDRYPSATAGIWGMDVILCRNVLIYLDREAIARVARRLVDSLSDEGWLFLGASDPSIADLAPVDVIVTDAGLVYRRNTGKREVPVFPVSKARKSPSATRSAERTSAPPLGDPQATSLPPVKRTEPASAPPVRPPPPVPEVPAPPTQSEADELSGLYWERRYPTVIERARALLEKTPAPEAVHILLVRALANQGDTAEAGRAVIEALELHPECPELHCLHAILLLGKGQARESLTAARRALYLQPDLVAAHLAFADAALHLGRTNDGARAMRNAERILSMMSPDEVVPASDGETAGRLLRIAQFRSQRLKEEVGSGG